MSNEKYGTMTLTFDAKPHYGEERYAPLHQYKIALQETILKSKETLSETPILEIIEDTLEEEENILVLVDISKETLVNPQFSKAYTDVQEDYQLIKKNIGESAVYLKVDRYQKEGEVSIHIDYLDPNYKKPTYKVAVYSPAYRAFDSESVAMRIERKSPLDMVRVILKRMDKCFNIKGCYSTVIFEMNESRWERLKNMIIQRDAILEANMLDREDIYQVIETKPVCESALTMILRSKLAHGNFYFIIHRALEEDVCYITIKEDHNCETMKESHFF